MILTTEPVLPDTDSIEVDVPTFSNVDDTPVTLVDVVPIETLPSRYDRSLAVFVQ